MSVKSIFFGMMLLVCAQINGKADGAPPMTCPSCCPKKDQISDAALPRDTSDPPTVTGRELWGSRPTSEGCPSGQVKIQQFIKEVELAQKQIVKRKVWCEPKPGCTDPNCLQMQLYDAPTAPRKYWEPVGETDRPYRETGCFDAGDEPPLLA